MRRIAGLSNKKLKRPAAKVRKAPPKSARKPARAKSAPQIPAYHVIDLCFEGIDRDSLVINRRQFPAHMRADLQRLRGKKLLHIVGENDKGHWIEGGEKGLNCRREVYAFERFKPYAKDLRLIVVPRLTHYGHVESYNERLANLMVTAFRDYFPR